MNPYVSHLTDRELLEEIYVLLLKVYSKIDRLDDDNREFSMNLAADLMSNLLQDRAETNLKISNNGKTGNN